MHYLPRHSAENECVLTNEWNNSFADGVSGGVQSPDRGDAETQGGRQRTSPHVSTTCVGIF